MKCYSQLDPMYKIQILLSVTLFQALKFIFLELNKRQCPSKKRNAMNIPAVLTDKLRSYLKLLLSWEKKNRMARAVKETMIWHGSTQQKKI
jgi:hypothetical protein